MERQKFNLKTWRANSGYTIQDVADKLGVSKPTVIKWEKPESKLPTLVRFALAKLYDIDIDSITN